MVGEIAKDRSVFRIGGADRVDFLQGLVTNDVNRLSDGLVYAALLSPQGKYLADFFLVPDGETILIDVQAGISAELIKRLTLYRLRADVRIDETDISVSRGLGDGPEGSFSDPRHADLGWRLYSAGSTDTSTETDKTDWDAVRVTLGVPETAVELVPDKTYILEAGFERLNGVDFKKGCYVGQEIVARMKHKTELRKGLARVAVKGSAPVGTPILTNGKPAGTLYTQSGGEGLADLRFDRARSAMQAGEAEVRLLD